MSPRYGLRIRLMPQNARGLIQFGLALAFPHSMVVVFNFL
jgi:hypothetical protein